jgi:AcrR family transcriptional regulator
MSEKIIPALERKNELVKAAFDNIARKGFEGLRVRDVAAVVEINPATMYYYFPNKESLIDSVIDYVFDRMEIFIEENPGTPKEQLHAHLTRLSRKMRDDPGLFAVFSEIQLRAGRNSSSEKYLKYEADWSRKLENLLHTGIRQGFWPNYMDPEQVAVTIILVIQGAGLQAINSPRRVENSIQQLERWLTGRY